MPPISTTTHTAKRITSFVEIEDPVIDPLAGMFGNIPLPLLSAFGAVISCFLLSSELVVSSVVVLLAFGAVISCWLLSSEPVV